MPILLIYGMPELDETAQLGQLLDNLAEAVEKIPELQLSEGEVSVFTPTDCVEAGLGEELVCLVEGLFVKPERTFEVRKKLAEIIKDILLAFAKEQLPLCELVEVLVKQFNPEKDGFASSLVVRD